MRVRTRNIRKNTGLRDERATLVFVIVVSPTCAKIVAVMFALAMLYGSVCSVSCVAGVCPNLERYSESHDCDQPSHHHSQGHDSDGQHSPDCRQHAHPADFALNASGIAPFRDQSTTALHAATVFALSNPLPRMRDSFRGSLRRPSGFPKNNLQNQVSVLRV